MKTLYIILVIITFLIMFIYKSNILREKYSLVENELKKCPVCGKKVNYSFFKDNKTSAVWIECSSCKLKTNYFYSNTLEDAKIKATKYWNGEE